MTQRQLSRGSLSLVNWLSCCTAVVIVSKSVRRGFVPLWLHCIPSITPPQKGSGATRSQAGLPKEIKCIPTPPFPRQFNNPFRVEGNFQNVHVCALRNIRDFRNETVNEAVFHVIELFVFTVTTESPNFSDSPL